MAFVIQIVVGKAEVRAVVLDVPGRADNAASGDLGANAAIMIRGTWPWPARAHGGAARVLRAAPPSSCPILLPMPTELASNNTHGYDVVVVGSGFGGSVAALRLVEKGYRVAVIEAGRRFADDEFARTSWDLR